MATLIIEQLLNGIQYGFSLFLISAGLTLIFGIMGVLNLAHGSLYMLGAYFISLLFTATESYLLAFGGAIALLIVLGLSLEYGIMRFLYNRDHLSQVLATFAIILFTNDLAIFLWGRVPLGLDIPEFLNGTVYILPDLPYPEYRLFVIAVGALVSLLLYYTVTQTRIGMRIRAGATNREMVGALGVNINTLYVMVFTAGVVLAGLAGMISAPLISIESGIGGDVLITSFVIIIIGGLGSIKGAFVSSLLVGLWETLSQAFIPMLLMNYMNAIDATNIGSGIAAISIYILMVIVLVFKPKGLYGNA